MELLYRLLDLFETNSREKAELAPKPAPVESANQEDELAIRHEDIPDTLDLGWYFSEGNQELQMAKIPNRDRATHCYVIGASGSGKTKFLEFLIQQDIRQGNGLGVIDPHGDLIEDVKGFLACAYDDYGPGVLNRVVLVDPTDPQYTVTFNPLEQVPGVSAAEQAQELVSAFKKIWSDSWGVRMEDLLRNSLIALGEAGLTLAELPHFLTNTRFRKGVLEKVTHPIAREYFVRFDTVTDRARITWIEPVMNKINALLSDDRIRQMLSSPQSSFNLREIMDTNQVLLIKLDKGRLQDSTDLLGSLFMAKIKMAAFSRSDVPQQRRNPFYLYIDEFQNFAADSFSVVLSEARKYGLSLVMAHQTLAQVPPELRSIVLGNTGIQVYFRVNRHDAQTLAKEAFEYSGYEVKSAGLHGHKYWSLGEEWERHTEELQNLPPRCCYVKHQIQGGLLPIHTAEIREPWEVLGMDEDEYEDFLSGLPIGRRYVLERSAIEQGVAERTRGVLVSPEAGYQEGETAVHDGETATPSQATSKPVAEPGKDEKLEELEEAPETSDKPQAPIYKELLVYLEHIAETPFLSALRRDETLNLSRYKGSIIRQRLLEAGYIRLHKVSTGTRSGQIVLQEITEAGYDLLASMKIRVSRPRSRGGFLHKYYCYKLKEFAEATWQGSEVRIEDGTLGKYADVTVRIPADAGEAKERVIAFEVYMTGEAKELRGIARGIEVFDQVIVCAESTTALDSLKSKAIETLGPEIDRKVSFNLVSQYLGTVGPKGTEPLNSNATSSRRGTGNTRTKSKAGSVLDIQPNQEQNLLKNATGLESEIEPPARSTPQRRRGRRPKTPLMNQVERAYINLHDLDWLQECELARLSEVQDRIDPRHTMPEAQAIRGLLIEAAKKASKDIASVPDLAGVRVFLEQYAAGKKVAEIAQELGVSREWCSRAYRKEAFRLAGMQFVRSISSDS